MSYIRYVSDLLTLYWNNKAVNTIILVEKVSVTHTIYSFAKLLNTHYT